jgi:hypothetical protein
MKLRRRTANLVRTNPDFDSSRSDVIRWSANFVRNFGGFPGTFADFIRSRHGFIRPIQTLSAGMQT